MNTPTSINELTQPQRERDWTDAEAHADPAGYRAYLERLRGHMLLEQNEAIVQLTRRRDELAACLREVRDGFVSGRFACVDCITGDGLRRFVEFVAKLDSALLRCDVRQRSVP